MKKTVFILSLFSIVSCNFFEQKKAPNEVEILDQQMKEINWKTVDKLPTVDSCGLISTKSEQNLCFFEFVTKEINQKIKLDSLSEFYSNKKFLVVKVSVFPNKPLLFQSIIKDSLAVNKPKIDSILTAKLSNFPLINPALKRGMPVKVQFLILVEN